MENANNTSLQVAAAAIEVKELAKILAIQTHGQGVDGEVPAMEIELDRARLNIGQNRRPLIEFLAGADKVDLLGCVNLASVALCGNRRMVMPWRLKVDKSCLDCLIDLWAECPLRRTKPIVAVDVAPKTPAQSRGQSNRVAFDHDVDVGRTLAQEQVSHQTTDEVDGHLQVRSAIANDAHKCPQRLRKRGGQQLARASELPLGL